MMQRRVPERRADRTRGRADAMHSDLNRFCRRGNVIRNRRKFLFEGKSRARESEASCLIGKSFAIAIPFALVSPPSRCRPRSTAPSPPPPPPPPVWLEMGFRRRRRRELFYVLSSSALFGGGGNGDSPRAAAAVCLSAAAVSAAPGEWMCGRASLAVAASAANPFCPPATLEAIQFD